MPKAHRVTEFSTLKEAMKAAEEDDTIKKLEVSLHSGETLILVWDWVENCWIMEEVK